MVPECEGVDESGSVAFRTIVARLPVKDLLDKLRKSEGTRPGAVNAAKASVVAIAALLSRHGSHPESPSQDDGIAPSRLAAESLGTAAAPAASVAAVQPRGGVVSQSAPSGVAAAPTASAAAVQPQGGAAAQSPPNSAVAVPVAASDASDDDGSEGEDSAAVSDDDGSEDGDSADASDDDDHVDEEWEKKAAELVEQPDVRKPLKAALKLGIQKLGIESFQATMVACKLTPSDASAVHKMASVMQAYAKSTNNKKLHKEAKAVENILLHAPTKIKVCIPLSLKCSLLCGLIV